MSRGYAPGRAIPRQAARGPISDILEVQTHEVRPALHAHLFSVTARSRRLMEEALSMVAAAEGILTKNGNQP